jgi:regulator of RNase E activity RraB
MTKSEIRKAIEGHNARNEELRYSLAKDAVDLKMQREIDFHFWVGSKEKADLLTAALAKHGFQVKASRRSVTADKRLPWNLELGLRQSIELTLRQELTDELVRTAARFDGRYDGWGTAI